MDGGVRLGFTTAIQLSVSGLTNDVYVLVSASANIFQRSLAVSRLRNQDGGEDTVIPRELNLTATYSGRHRKTEGRGGRGLILHIF